MIFYQIQDLNSGLFYKIGMYSGSWVEQQGATVWTNMDEPHGIQAGMDNIEAYNHWRDEDDKRKPVVQTIDTEAGVKVLRDLFAIRDLGDFHDEIRDAELGAIEDGEMEREGDTIRWSDAVDRARELLTGSEP